MFRYQGFQIICRILLASFRYYPFIMNSWYLDKMCFWIWKSNKVPVVTGNEWPLRSIVIIRSIQVIFLNFKEFSQTLYWPLGFTHQDMSYGVALDRSSPWKGIARRLTNHILRVSNISRIIQFADWYIYPGSILNRLKK